MLDLSDQWVGAAIGGMFFLSVVAIVVVPVLLLMLHSAEWRAKSWQESWRTTDQYYRDVLEKFNRLRSVPEEMVDRAMAAQSIRSDRPSSVSDRHWMRQSLTLALNEDQRLFPNAPGLDDMIMEGMRRHRLVLVQDWDPDALRIEDGGHARIYNISGDADEEAGAFVRLQSWDPTRQHLQFERLQGHRLRVVVEIADD